MLNKMKNLELIIEKNDGLLWGRVENKGNFTPTGAGESTEALIKDIISSIEDYKEHEGKEDKFWSKVDTESIQFELKYDFAAFLDKFNFFNLSVIADKLNIDKTLLSQYKTGKKHPTLEQAQNMLNSMRKLVKHVAETQSLV